MFRNLFIGLVLGFVVHPSFATVPVQAFFSYSSISSARISPDGKYLAMVVSDDKSGQDKRSVTIIDSTNRRVKNTFKVSDSTDIMDYWWANNERILIATATETGALSAATSDGALYAVNIDGTQSLQLLGHIVEHKATQSQNRPPPADPAANFTHIKLHNKYEEQEEARTEYMFQIMLYLPRDDTGHVLVEGWASNSQRMQVLDVDIYSGEVRKVVDSPADNGSFLADAEGYVRLAWGVKDSDGSPQLFYRDAGVSAQWRDLSALYKNVDAADGHTGPLMVAQDGKSFYWMGRTPSGTLGLFDVNPADMSLKRLYADDKLDVERYIFGDFPGNDHKILAVETYPGMPELHVIEEKDSEIAVLLALRQAFPGQEVDITSATLDGTMMVIRASSDRNPGDYYLFNRKTLKADHLFSTLDQIVPADMSAMRPVTLKARDGLVLHGYLTTPVVKPQKNLPMILLVHGGPHNIRDIWGWDPEVQFFANRGYAVLQVNYRGSGGYGLKFQSLGYRNWGTTMQDDLADAVEWAVQRGIADPKRVCIYGASYGGYAALENVIQYPKLYKCAVGYAGIYDLTLEAKYGDVHRSASGRNYLEIVNGNNQKELKKYSPVFNADKITVPVFIAFGGKDVRVVPDNAKELMKAMDKAGKKYEYLFYPYEVHGFLKPEDKFEFYSRMVRFIGENMGDNKTNVSLQRTAQSFAQP